MAEDITKLSDGELLDRSAAGEEGAFREIVKRYKNGLYAFLRNFLNRTDLIACGTLLNVFETGHNLIPLSPH